MNTLPYICLDTETTGLVPGEQEIVEICAVVYDPRTLLPVPASEGGEFYSMVRPLRPEKAQEQALAVNGFTLEGLAKEPDPRAVWPMFVKWVQGWNKSKTKNHTQAPILVGKNIKFDVGFLDAACMEFFHKKKNLFNSRFVMEVEHLLFLWHENTSELVDYKLDTAREYFGLTTKGAHRARTDVLQTGAIFTHYMKLHRALRKAKTADGNPLFTLKGCLSSWQP